MKRLLPILIVATLGICAASAAADPFTGTWRMDLRKSKYPAGGLPRSMVIEIQAEGDGIRYRSDTVDAYGRTTKAEYVAGYDGREAVVKGTVGLLLPVSLKRLNPYTVEASYLRGGQIVATSRRTVSKDGRVMTIITTSIDKDGKNVTNTGVYEKAGIR
jgi:hypothetical protein